MFHCHIEITVVPSNRSSLNIVLDFIESVFDQIIVTKRAKDRTVLIVKSVHSAIYPILLSTLLASEFNHFTSV